MPFIFPLLFFPSSFLSCAFLLFSFSLFAFPSTLSRRGFPLFVRLATRFVGTNVNCFLRRVYRLSCRRHRHHRHRRPQYVLELRASDSLHEGSTTVVIRIKDINDLPPKFEEASYSTMIYEEDTIGLPKSILKVSPSSSFPFLSFRFPSLLRLTALASLRNIFPLHFLSSRSPSLDPLSHVSMTHLRSLCLLLTPLH